MKPLVTIAAACAVATIAHAQTARLGQPLTQVAPAPPAVSVAADADQLPGHASSPDTAVLDIQLPKTYFDVGEPVTLTAHLHTRGGKDFDNGSIEVDDVYSTGVMDHGTPGKRLKGQAQGKGKHRATLDTRPGEHFITVYADALDAHGNSVHRATSLMYAVATGDIKFLDVGRVHPDGPSLVVPLKVVCRRQGVFIISAILAAGPIAVARADTEATLDTGAATVELRFPQADVVEAGPYHLANVVAHAGSDAGATLAAPPHDVGGLFQAAHADHEPAPLRNEEGELVGVVPGPGPDFSGPPPTPVIPEYVPPHPLAGGDPPVGIDPNPPTAPGLK